jgi:hypothetical protein
MKPGQYFRELLEDLPEAANKTPVQVIITLWVYYGIPTPISGNKTAKKQEAERKFIQEIHDAFLS